MVFQSNIRLPGGQGTRVEKVAEGVYVIANAYEGDYEYFAPPKPPDSVPPAQKPAESLAERK
jgi:hypothetical protein